MALIKYPLSGANSYVSRDDGDTYFDSYLNAGAWVNAGDGDKDASLIQATRDINREQYKGENNSAISGFKFPRSGLVDPEGNAINENTVPTFIEHATFELALAYLQNASIQKSTRNDGNIHRVAAGPVEIEFFRPFDEGRFPDRVQKLLAFYLKAAGAGSFDLGKAFGTDEVSGLEDFNRTGGFS